MTAPEQDTIIAQTVDGVLRRRYNVAVTKIPAADRDVARAVMPDDEAVVDRRFIDVIGADAPDDDPRFPVGAQAFYSLMLTDEEAHAFRGASNARLVELDQIARPL